MFPFCSDDATENRMVQAKSLGELNERRALVGDPARGLAAVPCVGRNGALDDRDLAPSAPYARWPIIRRRGRRSYAGDAARERSDARHHRGAAAAAEIVSPHLPPRTC